LITDFINSNCDGKKPGVTPASRNRQISEARLIRKGIRDFWIDPPFLSAGYLSKRKRKKIISLTAVRYRLDVLSLPIAMRVDPSSRDIRIPIRAPYAVPIIADLERHEAVGQAVEGWKRAGADHSSRPS
jgi:hypothetical protein